MEEHTYQMEKTTLVVVPVYKEPGPGEAISEILLKLMLADVEKRQLQSHP